MYKPITATLTLLLLLPLLVSAQCLSTEQQQLLEELADSSNVSAITLISIFNQLCFEDNYTRMYTDLKVEHLEADYNEWKNESSAGIQDAVYEEFSNYTETIDDRFNNYTGTIENKLEIVNALQALAEIMQSETRIDKIKDELSAEVVGYIDTIDAKIADMKETFATTDDLKGLNISHSAPLQYRAPDYTGYYILILICTIVGAVYYLSTSGKIKISTPFASKYYRSKGRQDASALNLDTPTRKVQASLQEDPELAKLNEDMLSLEKRKEAQRIKADIKAITKEIDDAQRENLKG